MAEGFDITVSAFDGTVRLILSGDLDLAAVSELRAALRQVTAEQAGTAVLVDLTNATFIGSTVVSVLEGGWRAARERGQAFVAVNANGAVRRALVLGGMAKTLEASPVLAPAWH